MNQLLKQMLLGCVCLMALTGHAIADAESDAKVKYHFGILHDSKPLFFEWIENGVGGGKQFVALKFLAREQQDGTKYAECTYTIYHINYSKKISELEVRQFSTDDYSIKNLSITPKSISFDMEIFLGGVGSRKINFVAMRMSSSRFQGNYQASADALWKGIFDEPKIIKVEWKQVPTITLPYPISN